MLPFRSELQRGLAFTSALLLLTACEPSTEQEQPAKAPIAQTAPAAVDAPVAEDSRSASVPAGQGFDFYVLSLSWSPSYCEAEGEDANRQQCETGRPYAFVVHGLWPQFERGYPESCQTSEADVQNATLRTLYDIMPSAGLIRYQ